MATPPRSSRPTVAPSVAVVRKVSLVLAGLAAIVLSPMPAQATPQPATAGDVATVMAARAHDMEKVTESFNAARDQLNTQQATAKAAQAAYEQAQVALATARKQVRGIARSAYTGNGNTFAALLTSQSASEFVDRVSTLQKIAGRQNAVLDQVMSVSTTAAQAEVTAQKAVAEAKATFDGVAAKQAALQKEINAYQADFDRLTAQEKQATLAGGTDHASRSDSRTAIAPAGPVVAGSQAAQIAVDTALAQRGKPYVWAATGPNAFDCSGLTQFAYAAAGVRIPRVADAQATVGVPVSRSQLQPGDLIFFYSPISHVGIYIGNGQMVHAPTFGDVVKVAGIDNMGAITAMRHIAG
jgi:cell wall-associated NlpC family hydrolase